MPLKFERKAVVVALLFSLAVICWPINEARAQTNLRQSVVLSDQSRDLTTYYLTLNLLRNLHGYSDTYGYGTYARQYLESAYSYAQQAAQYDLQDYNNGVYTTYYQAYNEYTTFNAIKNFLATSIIYVDLTNQNLDDATLFQYDKAALDNFYWASILYDAAAIYAGCFPQ